MSKRTIVSVSLTHAVCGAALAAALLAGCQTPAPAGKPSASTVKAMDANKDGKVTKDEYMKYHDQEFDRIDKDKTRAFDQSEWMRRQLEIEAGDQ